MIERNGERRACGIGYWLNGRERKGGRVHGLGRRTRATSAGHPRPQKNLLALPFISLLLFFFFVFVPLIQYVHLYTRIVSTMRTRFSNFSKQFRNAPLLFHRVYISEDASWRKEICRQSSDRMLEDNNGVEILKEKKKRNYVGEKKDNNVSRLCEAWLKLTLVYGGAYVCSCVWYLYYPCRNSRKTGAVPLIRKAPAI